MARVEVRRLFASYLGCAALRGVSLSLAPGEIVGICGPNKAGKSTLCKCLAGTMPSDSGEILLDGEDVSSLPAFRRITLGLSLCPEGRGNYAGVTVHDNFRLGAQGLSRIETRRRIDEVLEYFPILSKRLDQQAGSLSGGEAQMLAIARRLIRHPKVFIIDEPSLGLSPVALDSMFRALLQFREDFEISLILVEEAVVQLWNRVDRAYVLHMGEVVAEGKIEEIVKSAAVSAAFTGELGVQLE